MRKRILAAFAIALTSLGIATASAPAATSEMWYKANWAATTVCTHYQGCSGISYYGYYYSNYYYYGGQRHETAHWRFSYSTWYYGNCVVEVAVTDGPPYGGYTQRAGGACSYDFTF